MKVNSKGDFFQNRAKESWNSIQRLQRASNERSNPYLILSSKLE